MEPTKCPKCKKLIFKSDTICPHCRCEVNSYIEEHTCINQLGEDVGMFTGKGIPTLISGIVFLLLACLSFGTDTTSIVVFLLFGVVAVILLVSAFKAMFVNKKKGVCPYCKSELFLLPVDGEANVKCPVCGNTMKVTKETVETQFEVNGDEKLSKEDIDEYFIAVATYGFDLCGWTYWDSSVHHAEGQLDRLQRATTSDNMFVLDYDEVTKTARVSGEKDDVYIVNEHGCSCRDFRFRQLPCKHMYLVATEMVNKNQ